MTATAAGDDLISAFDAMIADADRHAQRVAGLKLTDHQKREFAATEMKSNVWPFLGALVRVTRDAWLDHEETLEELLEGEGSVVQPELAAMIFANLQAGLALVERVRKLKVKDDLRAVLDKLCGDYEASASVVDRAVADAAVEPEQETDDDAPVPLDFPAANDGADPEDEEEDEEEDDGDEDEPTAPGEVS